MKKNRTGGGQIKKKFFFKKLENGIDEGKIEKQFSSSFSDHEKQKKREKANRYETERIPSSSSWNLGIIR